VAEEAAAEVARGGHAELGGGGVLAGGGEQRLDGRLGRFGFAAGGWEFRLGRYRS